MGVAIWTDLDRVFVGSPSACGKQKGIPGVIGHVENHHATRSTGLEDLYHCLALSVSVSWVVFRSCSPNCTSLGSHQQDFSPEAPGALTAVLTPLPDFPTTDSILPIQIQGCSFFSCLQMYAHKKSLLNTGRLTTNTTQYLTNYNYWHICKWISWKLLEKVSPSLYFDPCRDLKLGPLLIVFLWAFLLPDSVIAETSGSLS
jgi:hypothetical protein